MMCLAFWQIAIEVTALTAWLGAMVAVVILAMGWLENRVDAWRDRRTAARLKKGGRR